MPSAKLMAQQLENQLVGINTENPVVEQDLNAGDISRKYPVDSLPGHAAWLDWPYKLHRIQSETEDVNLELYNLEKDPLEAKNLAETDMTMVESMMNELKSWQHSVMRSLNGEDYH